MSTWIWLALAGAFLAVGLAVMLGGLLVVARALSQQRDARLRSASTPPGAVGRAARPAAAADSLAPVALPDTKLPAADEDEWHDEVPTAVFRATDYKDIDALMQDADQYVQQHKRGR